MAIPRSSLTALDGFEQSIDWGALNARSGERLIRVLTGGPLLAVHLAVFGTTLFATMLWSLIQHPTDLGSLEGFRVWGVLVAVHAVLVGAWQLSARVLGWNEPDVVTNIAPARRVIANQEVQPKAAPPVRHWSPSAGGTTTDRPVNPAPGVWPQQPALLANTTQPDVGEVTWPDSAPLSTVLNASPATLIASDELVSIETAATGPAADGAQTWVDGFVESQTKPKEQRWSWVEAAAASWLSRRPSDGADADQPAEDVVLAASDELHAADDQDSSTGA